MKIAILILTVFAASTANAEIYKCVQNGRQVFSDMPCATNAEKLDVRPATGRADKTAADKANADTKARNQAVDQSMKKRDAESRISRAQHEIERLTAEKESKLAALRNRKGYARNNQAGAIWENSISEEMNSVTSDYNSRIEQQRQELSDARATLAALDK